MIDRFHSRRSPRSSAVVEGAEVANRVVGFTLRKVFREHNSLVTSLALVDDVDSFGGVFLISAGWDRRICVWDLTHFMLFCIFNNNNPATVDEAETASSGSILDMDYSPFLKCFGYASSDNCVYVRKFATRGVDMQLMYKLEIQIESEITRVKWNYLTNEWITGLENGEIRIWVEELDLVLHKIERFLSRKRMENSNKPSMFEEVFTALPLMMCRKHCWSALKMLWKYSTWRNTHVYNPTKAIPMSSGRE